MRRLPVLLISAVLVSAAACGDDSGDGDAATAELTVFAAASLTDAFDALGTDFEAAHQGSSITFNFAGSSALREQIFGGAPADVFASANTSNMDQVAGAGELDGEPVVFATNILSIAVPAENPAGITGLDDFADSALLIGLCAEEVPCGEFGREVLANAGVTPSIDTNEPDVRSLLAKLEAGELDAGIVYRTDVLAAGDAVDEIPIAADQNVVADYPIAVLAGASEPALALEFIDFVRSAGGQAILAEHGFGTP